MAESLHTYYIILDVLHLLRLHVIISTKEDNYYYNKRKGRFLHTTTHFLEQVFLICLENNPNSRGLRNKNHTFWLVITANLPFHYEAFLQVIIITPTLLNTREPCQTTVELNCSKTASFLPSCANDKCKPTCHIFKNEVL